MQMGQAGIGLVTWASLLYQYKSGQVLANTATQRSRKNFSQATSKLPARFAVEDASDKSNYKSLGFGQLWLVAGQTVL